MNLLTEQQINDTLSIIESSLINCQKVQPKLKEGSASLTISIHRIKALMIAKDLMMNQKNDYSLVELEKAIIQITSIKNKSITGLKNAKENSGTSTRFSKIIAAMDIILIYLQEACLQTGEQ